jgi:hypothetical protein
MKKATVVVFDDFVAGTPTFTVYTSQEFNKILGNFDKAAYHAIADQLSGNITAFSIDLQHSGDGRVWRTKTTNLIASTSISANTTADAVGTDAGTTPSLESVRLAINSTGTAAGQYHLKVIATLRDDS